MGENFSKNAEKVFPKSSENTFEKSKVAFFSSSGNTKMQKIGIFFFREMSHNAKNCKKMPSVLAKRFLSVKSRESVDQNKLDKSHTVPKKRWSKEHFRM